WCLGIQSISLSRPRKTSCRWTCGGMPRRSGWLWSRIGDVNAGIAAKRDNADDGDVDTRMHSATNRRVGGKGMTTTTKVKMVMQMLMRVGAKPATDPINNLSDQSATAVGGRGGPMLSSLGYWPAMSQQEAVAADFGAPHVCRCCSSWRTATRSG